MVRCVMCRTPLRLDEDGSLDCVCSKCNYLNPLPAGYKAPKTEKKVTKKSKKKTGGKE